MNEDLKKIHVKRSLFFQDFALIEYSINRLISLHYFDIPNEEKFINELLENEYFSFQLRKDLFKKIWLTKYPSIKFPWESLIRIQQLRNTIAHRRIIQRNTIDTSNIVSSSLQFYYYNENTKDIASLYEEFEKHLDKIFTALSEVSNDIKITIKKEAPI